MLRICQRWSDATEKGLEEKVNQYTSLTISVRDQKLTGISDYFISNPTCRDYVGDAILAISSIFAGLLVFPQTFSGGVMTAAGLLALIGDFVSYKLGKGGVIHNLIMVPYRTITLRKNLTYFVGEFEENYKKLEKEENKSHFSEKKINKLNSNLNFLFELISKNFQEFNYKRRINVKCTHSDKQTVYNFLKFMVVNQGLERRALAEESQLIVKAPAQISREETTPLAEEAPAQERMEELQKGAQLPKQLKKEKDIVKEDPSLYERFSKIELD